MKDKDISKNPEYFYCKKGKCTLRYDICLDRQLLYRENMYRYMEYIMCFKCEQGTQNKQTFLLKKYIIILDFNNYHDILDQLQGISNKEKITLNHLIIHMIKMQISQYNRYIRRRDNYLKKRNIKLPIQHI